MTKFELEQKLADLHQTFMSDSHWHEKIPGPIGKIDHPGTDQQDHVQTYMIPLEGDSMALIIHALIGLVEEEELIKIIWRNSNLSLFEQVDNAKINLRTYILTDGTLLKFCHDKHLHKTRLYVDEICIEGERYRIRIASDYQTNGEK